MPRTPHTLRDEETGEESFSEEEYHSSGDEWNPPKNDSDADLSSHQDEEDSSEELLLRSSCKAWD